LNFQAELGPDGTVRVPPEVASQLTSATFRVLLLIPDTQEDVDWKRLTGEQFLRGYAPGDAIYDE
jgi:hypothetical protein